MVAESSDPLHPESRKARVKVRALTFSGAFIFSDCTPQLGVFSAPLYGIGLVLVHTPSKWKSRDLN